MTWFELYTRIQALNILRQNFPEKNDDARLATIAFALLPHLDDDDIWLDHSVESTDDSK